MPLTLPDLDDRTYADLVAEARAMIPAYAPEWTNHNAADPGITLVEMFAFLAEMLIYRLNRVTDANIYAFLRLLNGPSWQPTPGRALNDEIRDTMAGLRETSRAVTCDDFEKLCLAADPRVARARCVARRNFDSEDPNVRGLEKAGHVSVVIVPGIAMGGSPPDAPEPDADLLTRVKDYLEPRRLLTTRVHVVGPRYLPVGVRVTLTLKRDAVPDTVRGEAVSALRRFLHPLTGGRDGLGWPFGRDVYVSEVYGLLDLLPGVDYVTRTGDQDELVTADTARLAYNDRHELIGVVVRDDELVMPDVDAGMITCV